MALFDIPSGKLSWSSESEGADRLYGPPFASQDALGHIAVRIRFGVRSDLLYVIDPADGANARLPGPKRYGYAWLSNDADAHAEDLDGDGIFELVVSQNPYDPTYPGGPTTLYRFGWHDGDYVSIGCTVTEDTGASRELPAGHAGCRY